MGHPAGSPPRTTPQWTNEDGGRGRLYLLIALLLALLAGVLTFLYLDGIRQRSVPTGKALVARRQLRPGELLTEDSIELREVPLAVLPKGALTEEQAALGRRVVSAIAEGETVLRQDIAGDGAAGLSGQLPDGRWGMILPAGWLVSPLARLQEGDHIDIMAYQQGHPAEEIGLIVESIEILDLPGGESGPSTVTLAVSLEEAASILYARSNGFQLLGLLRPHEG